MSKFIFLDIDGVLNAQQHQWALRSKGLQTSDNFGLLFDPKAVAQLRRIVKHTGASIVLISSWKYLGFETMAQMWSQRALPGQLLDVTPVSASDEVLLSIDLEAEDFPNLCKGVEVDAWLRQHNQLDASYVIIDDDEVPLSIQVAKFVQPNPIVGLSERDSERAISILLNKPTSL